MKYQWLTIFLMLISFAAAQSISCVTYTSSDCTGSSNTISPTLGTCSSGIYYTCDSNDVPYINSYPNSDCSGTPEQYSPTTCVSKSPTFPNSVVQSMTCTCTGKSSSSSSSSSTLIIAIIVIIVVVLCVFSLCVTIAVGIIIVVVGVILVLNRDKLAGLINKNRSSGNEEYQY